MIGSEYQLDVKNNLDLAQQIYEQDIDIGFNLQHLQNETSNYNHQNAIEQNIKIQQIIADDFAIDGETGEHFKPTGDELDLSMMIPDDLLSSPSGANGTNDYYELLENNDFANLDSTLDELLRMDTDDNGASQHAGIMSGMLQQGQLSTPTLASTAVTTTPRFNFQPQDMHQSLWDNVPANFGNFEQLNYYPPFAQQQQQHNDFSGINNANAAASVPQPQMFDNKLPYQQPPVMTSPPQPMMAQAAVEQDPQRGDLFSNDIMQMDSSDLFVPMNVSMNNVTSNGGLFNESRDMFNLQTNFATADATVAAPFNNEQQQQLQQQSTISSNNLRVEEQPSAVNPFQMHNNNNRLSIQQPQPQQQQQQEQMTSPSQNSLYHPYHSMDNVSTSSSNVDMMVDHSQINQSSSGSANEPGHMFFDPDSDKMASNTTSHDMFMEMLENDNDYLESYFDNDIVVKEEPHSDVRGVKQPETLIVVKQEAFDEKTLRDMRNVNHNHTYDGTNGVRKLVKKTEPIGSRKSRDERKAEELGIPFTLDEIIFTPVEDFNEMLAKFQLSNAQSLLIKDIRRRGKNKIAAQNCRKRKVETINNMEDGVDSLRKKKEDLLAAQQLMIKQKLEMEKQYRLLEEKVVLTLQSNSQAASSSTMTSSNAITSSTMSSSTAVTSATYGIFVLNNNMAARTREPLQQRHHQQTGVNSSSSCVPCCSSASSSSPHHLPRHRRQVKRENQQSF